MSLSVDQINNDPQHRRWFWDEIIKNQASGGTAGSLHRLFMYLPSGKSVFIAKRVIGVRIQANRGALN
jgi:hypothetical protein